jgi:uncharacterized membrane protein
MNLFAESLGFTTLSLGWLLWALALIYALIKAPWYKVKGDRVAQNVFLGLSVIVMFVWQFGASLGGGVTFHFLLVSLLVLMFGPAFAIISASLALFGVSFYSGLGWLSLGINGLLMILIPVLITYVMLRMSERYLEQNFFVYVFFNGFLAAGLAVVMSLSLGGYVLWVNEAVAEKVLLQSFFPYIPMMAGPEGFLNGMLIAAIIILKPEWIATFSDDTHLKGK